MSKSAEARPIRLALNIENKALADRLAALLANVPGLRVVSASDLADVALVLSTAVSASADDDVSLTPRELEVLTLLAEGMSNKAIARRLGIRLLSSNMYLAPRASRRSASSTDTAGLWPKTRHFFNPAG